MKIALVKRQCSLKRGGSEKYCVMLARHFKKAGHNVTVIGAGIDDELRDEIDFIPVSVHRLASWTKNRSFAVNCGEAVAGRNFDFVYGLGRAFGLDAVRVTERLQSHWVNVYYNGKLNQSLQRLNPRHRTLIDLERTIYNSPTVRQVVTQSELDRQLVMRYYGVPEEKIRIIRNGIDTTTFNPQVRHHHEEVRSILSIPNGAPLLIFASMDFEGKGLHTILQAISNAKNRDIHLLVLGDGPIRKFQSVARSLGIGKRVIFAGRRTGIQRYYSAGDLFILPTEYEPFPNVNLEAMACGLPVLTTTTSGGADIVDEDRNGYLIPHRKSLEEMVAAIDHHLEKSSAELQAMSEVCWETAKPLTIEKNVQNTLAMMDDVLTAKHSLRGAA